MTTTMSAATESTPSSGSADSKATREHAEPRRWRRLLGRVFVVALALATVSMAAVALVLASTGTVIADTAMQWYVGESRFTIEQLREFKGRFGEFAGIDEATSEVANPPQGVWVGVSNPGRNFGNGGHSYVLLRWDEPEAFWVVEMAKVASDQPNNKIATVRAVPRGELDAVEGFRGNNNIHELHDLKPLFDLHNDDVERSFLLELYRAVDSPAEPYGGRWTTFQQCATWILDQLEEAECQLTNPERRNVVPSSLPYVLNASTVRLLNRRVPGILRSVGPGTVLFLAYDAEVAKLKSLGVLPCYGQAVAREGEYEELFKAIGETWGAGDGATTFHVPDFRGEFIRGWRANRVGVDDGRVFGKWQEDATSMPADWSLPSAANHEHVAPPQFHAHAGAMNRSALDVHQAEAEGADVIGTPSHELHPFEEHMHRIRRNSAESGAHDHTVTGWDGETRPPNQALLVVIKY